MKVSVALHHGEVDHNGNQRQQETHYRGYNRQYANLEIDPITGEGFADFNVDFPAVTADPDMNFFFSLGTCIAPQDLGGSLIITGSITGGLECEVGFIPNLEAACIVERGRLEAMDLVVFEDEAWREKTVEELKVTIPTYARAFA